MPRTTSPKPAAPALDRWVSFGELRHAGIVASWKMLKEWQNDPRIGFPLGRLLAPNTRRWSMLHDIAPWLASRPVEREAFDEQLNNETAPVEGPQEQLEPAGEAFHDGATSARPASKRSPVHPRVRAKRLKAEEEAQP
jgi:hypothetical protein